MLRLFYSISMEKNRGTNAFFAEIDKLRFLCFLRRAKSDIIMLS